MAKTFLAVVSFLLFAISGFFAFALGSYIANMSRQLSDGTLSLLLVSFFVSSFLCFFAMKGFLKSDAKKLRPFLGVLLACFVSGIAYDLIRVPEGFKLIGLSIVLLLVGWMAAKRVAANLRSAAA